MFWKIIERTVSLTYLLLAFTIIIILLTNSSQIQTDSNAAKLLELYKQENAQVRSRNINYLENKINTVAGTQDSYQISTTSRIHILEKAVERLEQQSKITPKVVNNNNSNAVVNMGSNGSNTH